MLQKKILHMLRNTVSGLERWNICWWKGPHNGTGTQQRM